MSLIVDLNTNTVKYKDQTITVTGQVAEFLHVVNSRWPSDASYEVIKNALWGSVDREPESAHSGIRIIASKARRDLAPLDVDVKSQRGAGYRIILPDQPKRAPGRPVGSTDTPKQTPQTPQAFYAVVMARADHDTLLLSFDSAKLRDAYCMAHANVAPIRTVRVMRFSFEDIKEDST